MFVLTPACTAGLLPCGQVSGVRPHDMPGVPGTPSTSSARSWCGRNAPNCRPEPWRSPLCPVHQRQAFLVIQRDDPLDQPATIILQPL